MENDWGDGLTGEDWASILETEGPSSGSSLFDLQYEGLSWSGSGTSGMTSSSQPSLKNSSKDKDSITQSSPKSTSGTSSTPSSSTSAAAAKPTTQQPLRKSCELCRSRKKKCDGDGLNRCRSPASLMMTALVAVCGAYGLTVAERKTETMVMRPPYHAQEDIDIVAAGQRYAQTEQFVYLGGTITAEADMTAEIRHRTGAAWSAFRRYANVVYDRPTAIVPMALKV